MRSQIRSTEVERERAPPAAERRPATVAVLQIQQPARPVEDRAGQFVAGPGSRLEQGEYRSGRIVSIRHATGQVSPGPASGVGIRVRMNLPVLLSAEPVAQGFDGIRWQI